MAALGPEAVSAAVSVLEVNLARAAGAGAGPADRLRALLDRGRGLALEDATQHAAVLAVARARVAGSCAAELTGGDGGAAGGPSSAGVGGEAPPVAAPGGVQGVGGDVVTIRLEAERAREAADRVLNQARAAANAHLARLSAFNTITTSS